MTLFGWFITRCLVPSGRKKRYYMYGTPDSMWVEYMNYCVKLGEDYIDEDKFHKIREKERIGILKGDIFMNPLKHDLAEAKSKLDELQKNPRPNQKQKTEIALTQKSIKDMEAKLAWIAAKKKEYKDAHLNLENDNNRAVITLDFFGTGKTTTSLGDDDGDFNDLILVIATKNELVIPKSLLDSQVDELTPASVFTKEISQQLLDPEKSPRSTRGPYQKIEKEITSHTQSLKKQRREREMPPVDVSLTLTLMCHTSRIFTASQKRRLARSP